MENWIYWVAKQRIMGNKWFKTKKIKKMRNDKMCVGQTRPYT